jgi:hypothetical protein
MPERDIPRRLSPARLPQPTVDLTAVMLLAEMGLDLKPSLRLRQDCDRWFLTWRIHHRSDTHGHLR